VLKKVESGKQKSELCQITKKDLLTGTASGDLRKMDRQCNHDLFNSAKKLK
jgi:hypothetical protein